MARTIDEIKSEITSAWMNNTTLAEAYGFDEGTAWESTFSKVCIENLLCYIVAAAIWAHEKLFDSHREEVEEIISAMKPHSLRWYVAKVKDFRAGQALIDGTDKYDDTGLTDEEIESMRVVKFAAASERDSVVYVKVAGESNGNKVPLSAEQEAGLSAYIREVKDAGVQIFLINDPPCLLKLSLAIYYDPMVLDATGSRLADGSNPVEDAIKGYIENLPFNGEYRNDELVDVLQQVEGVEIPVIISASESFDGVNYNIIGTRAIPESGYYLFDKNNITINFYPYEPL